MDQSKHYCPMGTCGIKDSENAVGVCPKHVVECLNPPECKHRLESEWSSTYKMFIDVLSWKVIKHVEEAIKSEKSGALNATNMCKCKYMEKKKCHLMQLE